MKLNKRIGAMALSAALLMGTLAGCGPQEAADATPTPSPSTSPTPTQTATPMVDSPDVVEKLLGFPRDTAVLTVNGNAVTAEEFLYFLTYVTETVAETVAGSVEELDWDGELEGTDVRTYLIDSAVESAEFYTLIRAEADRLGVTLTEADQASLDSQRESVIAQLGGEDKYALYIQAVGLSDEGMQSLNAVNPLYYNIQDFLFGEDGEQAPTEEELISFAEETADALLAKHILIKTVDDANEPLSDEEIAQAKSTAEDLLEQLRASEDPLALFDELMNEYSEDGRYEDGTLAAPDGYLFTAGQMVEEFETATRALEYNEISDLVESPFGYHIILRLPPVNDEVRQAYATQSMNDLVDELMASAVVETTETFASIDPKTYYEALSALRDEISAQLFPEEETSGETQTGEE